MKQLRADFIIPDNKKLKKNTIFICMSNGSREHLGKVAFVDKDYDCAFGGFMGLIIPNDYVVPKYLYHSLRCDEYKKFLSSIGNGANIRNLKFSSLSEFLVPLPPLSLQRTFAARVESIERQKGLVRESIAETGTLLSSRMQEYFG